MIVVVVVVPLATSGVKANMWNYNSDGYIYTGTDSDWYSIYL
jgi:hypothetical protein